jgi:hypothetical protein
MLFYCQCVIKLQFAIHPLTFFVKRFSHHPMYRGTSIVTFFGIHVSADLVRFRNPFARSRIYWRIILRTKSPPASVGEFHTPNCSSSFSAALLEPITIRCTTSSETHTTTDHITLLRESRKEANTLRKVKAEY